MEEPRPLVTGISPNEGIPGTKIILRGEHLGINFNDLTSVKICGLECISTLEYISNRKIAARTGRCTGKGDIIIITTSGGVGTSLVTYTGKFDRVGPLQEVGYWADEDIPAIVGLTRRPAVAGSLSEDLLGIQDSIMRRESLIETGGDEESIDVTRANFSPSLYIAKTKSGANFDDLKKGLTFLRNNKQSSHNSTLLIKNNIVSLIDAVDIVADMKGNLISNHSLHRMTICCQELDDILQSSHHLFDNDLQRNKEADSIRSTINVLHRFKFLFFLPKNIVTCIKQGEYDKAINDFLRAKSLYEDTEVGILKAVYNEVLKEINNLKSLLQERLFACPQTPENRKSFIRQLETLGEDGQILAKECVQVQSNWAVDQITLCFPLSDEELDKCDAPDIVHEAVDGICEITVSLMREVVKIGNMLVKGGLCSTKAVDIHENVEFVANNINIVHTSFTKRIYGILLRTGQKVDAGMFGKNLLQKGRFLAYLNDILPYGTRVCRFTIYELNLIDIPSSVRSRLLDLLFNLRAECLSVILLKAAYDVAMLYSDLDWTLKKDERIGAYTTLPEKFELTFAKALQSAKLHALHYDISKKEKDILSDRKLNRSSQLLIYGVIAAFFSTFENIIATTNLRSAKSMSLAKRCVLLFNNLEYTHQSVFTRLENLISSMGYKDAKRLIDESSESFEECCVKVSQTFLKQVVNPLSDQIERDLIHNIPGWHEDSDVKGVQTYVKQAIFKTVNLHAEISSISLFLTSRLVGETLNVICNDISTIFGKISDYTESGAHRAYIDLSAIELAFHAWLTNETKIAIQNTLEFIQAKRSFKNSKLTLKCLNEFRDSMQLVLKIFQK